MDKLYLVMPAYNEEDNIEAVVRSWYPVFEASDVSEASKLVIADSGSTDKTHEILLRLKAELPRLEILEATGKQHGPKLIALYNYAISKGADYIFQTDSDGQTSPNEFAGFWKVRHEHDAVIGKRMERGDGKDRAFVEHVVCMLLRLYFGVKVPDANAPFRLMKASVINKYMDRFDADYALPNIMLTTFLAYYGDDILFKDISFKPRQGGTNSINIPRIVKIGLKSLGEFHSFKKDMNK